MKSEEEKVCKAKEHPCKAYKEQLQVELPCSLKRDKTVIVSLPKYHRIDGNQYHIIDSKSEKDKNKIRLICENKECEDCFKLIEIENKVCVACPYCGEPVDIDIEAGKQVLENPHPLDYEDPRYQGRNDEIIRECKNQECSGNPDERYCETSGKTKNQRKTRKFHVTICNGKISTSYKHFIEKILELPTKRLKKPRYLFNLIGYPTYKSILILAMAVFLGFALATFFPTIFYLKTFPELLSSKLVIIQGLIAAIILIFFYKTIKDVRVVCGEYEGTVTRHEFQFYKVLQGILHSKWIFLLIFVLLFIEGIFDNYGYDAMAKWAIDIAGLGLDFSMSFGSQVIIGYIAILIILHYEDLEGVDFFELERKNQKLLDISLNIIVLLAILVALYNISRLFLYPPFHWELHPIAGGGYWYYLAQPLVIIILPFVLCTMLVHGITSKIKKRELAKIRENMTQMSNKLTSLENDGKDQERYYKMSSLCMMEDKISKAKEYPFSAKVIGQLITSLAIALIPSIIKVFIL